MKPHSRLGIASCIVAAGMFSLFLLSCATYAVWFKLQDLPQPDLQFAGQLMGVMVLPLPVHGVGFLMGAVALFFPSRRKAYPLLGMALNVVFGFVGLLPWLYAVGAVVLSGGVK